MHIRGWWDLLQAPSAGCILPGNVYIHIRVTATGCTLLQVPSGNCEVCNTLHAELLFLDRLFTVASSSSGLHHDFHDNLYILLRGRKRFHLWSPE